MGDGLDGMVAYWRAIWYEKVTEDQNESGCHGCESVVEVSLEMFGE